MWWIYVKRLQELLRSFKEGIWTVGENFMKRILTFLHDADGVSITDFLSLLFCVPIVVAWILLLYLSTWHSTLISDKVLQVLHFMDNPVAIILGGYFGNKIVGTAMSTVNNYVNQRYQGQNPPNGTPPSS